MRTYGGGSRSHGARPHSFLSIVLAAVTAVAFGCAESPTSADQAVPGPNFGHRPGHGGGGGGGSTVTFVLPDGVPDPGVDGLFSDGSIFTESFNPDGMAINVDCTEGTFVLHRPDDWPLIAGATVEVHCSSSNGGGFSRLDLNDLGRRPCSVPAGCSIGTTGHTDESGPGFAEDLNYYFTAGVPKTKGKGFSAQASYNVVWIDALFTIDQTGTDGIGCRWHLWATQAEFWEDTASGPQQVGGVEAMALDVVVQRQDLACP